MTLRHERRAIGREERDNTFRSSGSVLEAARTPALLVSPEDLAARQRALYQGGRFTTGLTSVGVDASQGLSTPAAASPAAVRPPAATAGRANVGWMFVALFGVGLAGFVGLAAWTVRHQRALVAAARAGRAVRTGPSSETSPPQHEIGRPSRHHRNWAERDLKIIMGQRDE